MPEKITKAQRRLDLVVFLLRHRLQVTVEEIVEAIRAYAADWRRKVDLVCARWAGLSAPAARSQDCV